MSSTPINGDEIEFYFSYRSPYSFLAIDRFSSIIEKYQLTPRLRLIRPLMLRDEATLMSRPQMIPYILRDFPREAERLGVSMHIPNPDPVVINPETGGAVEEQPYMDMLFQLTYAAERAGVSFPFAVGAARAVWSGDPWWNNGSLQRVGDGAGLDVSAVKAAPVSREELLAWLRSNEADQQEHHWGVPLFVFRGEPFFGQDRLDALDWRLARL